MKVNGEILTSISAFKNMMTVPDCIVVQSNKLGIGHGEAKFYISSKKEMYDFYGEQKFEARCFMLKKDLIAYMMAIKTEYENPSQEYAKKEQLPSLWSERMDQISKLDDVIFFTIHDQNQITGSRGYINSTDKGYQIIRTIALPLVSYVYAEKVGDEKNPLFYWKLYVDFDAIWEKKNGPLVFNYGKSRQIRFHEESEEYKAEPIDRKTEEKQKEIRYAREGQGKYREQLLAQCPYCPITMISDERLLIASHIKPWAASSDAEKTDPYNGYMLSPMFDKLFDRGFITFTKERHIILSGALSPYVWKKIGCKDNSFIGALPMDEKRIEYLEFHHNSVFKGTFDN